MIHIPHLETEITQACQLSCVGCNHSVPLWRAKGPWTAKPEHVQTDLNRLAKFLHAERWGALGGEPLLNKKLLDILSVVHASDIADKIEVWTNGLLLPRQTPEFWESFDILVLSVYEGKHDEESLAWIRRKCEETGRELVVKDERIMRNFRTMLEPAPTSPAVTRAKYAGCFFRHFSRNASYGYFFTCCCAPHLPMLLQGQPFGTDGVLIETATEESLRAYLAKAEPLGACTICAGRDTAKPLEWREERDPRRWTEESAGR